MTHPADRYEGRPAEHPWTDYRSNVLWGLASAVATVVLIGVFQRLVHDQQWLPYLLAPAAVVLVLLPLRRYLRRRAAAETSSRRRPTRRQR